MTELQALRDRENITELINNLFVAVDNHDWAAARACFAERVHFDMTSLGEPAPAELAPEQITSAWESGLAPLEAVHHQSGNFRVRVAGDEAECFCYGIAYHYRRVRSGNNTRLFVGSYDYRLVRAGETWRITHFKFNAKFVDGNLRLESEEPA
jgi:3-phenylpropionate/cinnamic acid dioxygenase small subunit